MLNFETVKVRNVGIVGQGDAGKTSLVEAILFNTGMTDRLGKVDDGSSFKYRGSCFAREEVVCLYVSGFHTIQCKKR